MVPLWLLLVLQVKVGKVASFVGKNFSRENYPLYGNYNSYYIQYTYIATAVM